MNIATTIEIYTGGPGSGCQGPNCGRKPVVLEPWEDGQNLFKGSDTYMIQDADGYPTVRMAVFRKGDTLVVDYIARDKNNPETGKLHFFKEVLRQLKEKYPGVKFVTGDRVTGIHERLRNKDRAKAGLSYRDEAWTKVPIHAWSDS